MKSLLEQLQSFVDPFDLDVFTPYIQSNLHRQLHRSNVRHSFCCEQFGCSVGCGNQSGLVSRPFFFYILPSNLLPCKDKPQP